MNTPPRRPLSDREREIVAQVARGRSNKQIGESLDLSALTVKSHLHRIARKVGTGSRAGIVAAAYRNGDLATLTAEPREPLTLKQRERQVLIGMSYGLNNEEIGRRLFISEDTVKTHARRLFQKLQAKDRAHAVALGYQHGHLSLTPPVLAAAA